MIQTDFDFEGASLAGANDDASSASSFELSTIRLLANARGRR